MKLRHLLPAALMVLPLGAAAVPAYPGLIPHTLADGTTVMVRIHGDEYFNYMTDEAGFLLTQEGGRLSYETLNGARVRVDEQTLAAMRQTRRAASGYKALDQARQHRMATLNKEGRTTFPTIGDVHFLVLLVQFTDKQFNYENPKEEMWAKLNQEGYSKYGSIGSMRDYYIAASDGKFRPTFDVSDVIQLDHESAFYAGNGKYDEVQTLVYEATTKAHDHIDYSKYDYDGDGEVDNVIIFYAGYGQADSPDKTAIWPHQGRLYEYSVAYDGKSIGTYCCFNELNGSHYYAGDKQPVGIGTAVHEFGHVMGMPDLYDPSYAVQSTPARWSLMDQGSYLGDGYTPPLTSGYESWMFNWLEYETVEDNTVYDLEPLTKKKRVLRIPVFRNDDTEYANEYFLLESRKKEGWDINLPNEGMLIWHLDYSQTVWQRNTVNSTRTRPRCHLITSDGSANYKLDNYNASSVDAAWPGVQGYITPDTEITFDTNSTSAKYRTGNTFIHNIEFDVESGNTRFDYNTISATPDDVTVMNTPGRVPGSNGSLSNEIELTWEPVEGAVDYKLTVFRLDSKGNRSYENRLNDKSVGNVTSYVLPRFSSSKMGLEYHAYVRVVKPIPSSEISNEVLFVGDNLEASGIGQVEAGNAAIYGLKGAIEAPEGAEVYSISGVRTGTTGLDAGIYIVRYNGTVTKVAVK